MPDLDPPAPAYAAATEDNALDTHEDAGERRSYLADPQAVDSVDFDAALGEALAAVERLEHKSEAPVVHSRDGDGGHGRQEVGQLRRDLEEGRRDLEEARRELAKTKAELGRAQGDLASLRRLTQRLEADLPNQTARRLLGDLLPALDHLHTLCHYLLQRGALSAADQQAVEMLDTEWKRALQRLQLEPYDAVGQPFDAQLHEVIATVADPSQPAGAVLRQAGRGYHLAGKLLRMASVVVNAVGPGRSGG